jgi:hypothetical protein
MCGWLLHVGSYRKMNIYDAYRYCIKKMHMSARGLMCAFLFLPSNLNCISGTLIRRAPSARESEKRRELLKIAQGFVSSFESRITSNTSRSDEIGDRRPSDDGE